MQDLGPDDVSALCAACHEIGQAGLPVIVVGAGLPHLPAVLSAGKSYSERLFSYQRIDRLTREEADRALTAPAQSEDASYDEDALAALYDATGGYPYFVQAYGKTVWDLAPRSPITADDVAVAAPEAERELAVGLLRQPLRAGDAGGAGLPAGDGGRRGAGPARRAGRRRLGRHRRRRGGARQEAAVALAGPRRAAEEGPHLLRRARAGSRSRCRTSDGTSASRHDLEDVIADRAVYARSMQRAALSHDENVIGAAVLLLADRMREAVEPVTGTTGASAAGLTALLAWADGAHIDALAAGLRLSHSRAVRVVDGLEQRGLPSASPIRPTGAGRPVHLTARGRAAATRAWRPGRRRSTKPWPV